MFSILLVDDEAVEREGVAFLLQRGGFPFEVYQAENGKRAWEFLQRQPVDVLVTDVKMPYMDGLELSKLVCDYYPDTTIIIFSAYGEFEYAKRAMEAKALHYLLKPVEVDEFHSLLRCVTELCQSKAAQRLQHQQQAKNEQKLALMQLLSGSPKPACELERELAACGLALSNQYLRLLHLEAQGDYFATHEALFAKLADTYCPWGYVTVSFFPSATFLLLFSPTMIKNEAVAACAQQLCRDVQRVHGEAISALCGASLHGTDALAAEAATLLAFRKRFYTAQGSVLFVHDYLTQDAPASPAIESARSALETAIERRDEPEIKARLAKLFGELRLSPTLDATYLNHILYDLATRLYIRYDRYSSQALSRKMEELLRCAELDDMERGLSTTVNALTAAEPPPCDETAANAIQKVLRIIQREYAAVLSLDYLAERTGVTPSYLSALFKRETGESLVKYLTDYRLKQARLMLEEGSTKVSRVAKACGYENVSYFNRIFKARYGVTPSTLRGREEEGEC